MDDQQEEIVVNDRLENVSKVNFFIHVQVIYNIHFEANEWFNKAHKSKKEKAKGK